MTHPIKSAALIVGSQKELAKQIGLAPSFLSQCVSGHRKLPITYCGSIETLTKGIVTKEALRPDIFHAEKSEPG